MSTRRLVGGEGERQASLKRMIPFNRAFSDQTGGQKKILRRDFLREGLLPVVDQGSEPVAGYTNDGQAAYRGRLPVLLFGDHTRHFKYVDFPFALGADGVKVLQPAPWYEAKFLYYYLLTVRIPSRGYSRHFQFLRQAEFPLIPHSEQRRIVEILDQADSLRRRRSEVSALADHILPALFISKFGDPATNPKGWPVAPLGECLAPVQRRNPCEVPDEPFTYIDIAGVDGTSGVIAATKQLLGADAPSRARQVVRAGDVLVSTVRPYLRATAMVPADLDGQICSTGFCVLRTRTHFGRGHLFALSRMQWFTDQLTARARGASYPAVTDDDIWSLPVPLPTVEEALERFDELVQSTALQRDKRGQAQKNLELLFSSLQTSAFSGSLTASWREAHMRELLQEMEQQAKALAAS